MALLDSIMALFGGGGGLIPPMISEAGAQPQPQVQQGPGMLDRLGAGTRSFLGSSNPIEGIVNGLGGLTSGKRTDPGGIQQEAIRGMLNHLVQTKQITPTQAQFMAATPSSWGELSKAMINQGLTVAPDGSLISQGPFGQPTLRGGVPVSDPREVTNPDGSKSPAYGIRPSLTNPQGRVAVPGAPAQAPVGPAPQGQGPLGQRPTLDPNLPNGGRIITEASPQATEERKGVGGMLAKEYEGITNKAAAATRQLNTLRRMSQLSPQAFEGAAAPAMQMARSVLVSLGLPSDKVAAGEEFTALTNKMVLDANNGSLGVGVSNADVEFLKNIQPNISQTSQGRSQIIDMLTRLAKRDQDVAKEASKYRQQTGSMDGFQVYIQDWADKNPLFAGMKPPTANFSERFGAITDPRPGAPGIRIIGVR